MIQCPRCHAPNNDDSRFCSNCALPVQSQPSPPITRAPAPKPVFSKGISPGKIVAASLIAGVLICSVIAALLVSAPKPKEVASVKAAPTQAPATPTPIPEFADLKKKSEPLLAMTQDSYESADPKQFDDVMQPLRAIPKDSKDYKAAQALNKKLIDKSSVVMAERIVLGPKPTQSEWDGDVLPVKTYLKATLNDYDNSEFVEWSPVTKIYIGKEPYWGVRLKLRAKNAFGAYLLRDTYYYMRHNQVIISKGLNGE